MKKLLCVLLAVACVSLSACGGSGSTPTPSPTQTSTPPTATLAPVMLTTNDDTNTIEGMGGENKVDDTGGIAQLEGPKSGDQVAIITTNYGVIKIFFFPDVAPLAVENFVTHSQNGYYDGLNFHRVIKDFMIQGGDPLGTGMGGESIWGGSFGSATPGLYEVDINARNIRGALSMAHSQQADSNGSQFFIVQNHSLDNDSRAMIQNYINYPIIGTNDETGEEMNPNPLPLMNAYLKNGGAPWLDLQYTVFGQVYSGMNVVDAIANAPVNGEALLQDAVVTSIKIGTYN